MLWQDYVSPSGRFVMRWRFGFSWVRMDGRLCAVNFRRFALWQDFR